MSGVIGALQTPQTIPDAALPVHGVPGSRSTFYLRSTPKVFTLLAAGQSNQDFQIAAVQAVEPIQRLLDSRTFGRLGETNPAQIELAAQTRTRALGSPTLHPQARVASLSHSRSLGAAAVIVPPVEPPVEPPVPPPFTPVASPRTLRYVRRRNRPRERGS